MCSCVYVIVGIWYRGDSSKCNNSCLLWIFIEEKDDKKNVVYFSFIFFLKSLIVIVILDFIDFFRRIVLCKNVGKYI